MRKRNPQPNTDPPAQYEIDWADIMKEDGTHDGWKLEAHGKQLLEEGWEPFAVINLSIYRPELEPPIDIYNERVWFRRQV